STWSRRAPRAQRLSQPRSRRLQSIRLQLGSPRRRSFRVLQVLRSESYPDVTRREPMANRQLASPTWQSAAAATFLFVRRVWRVAKRSAVSFYDDQGTHHAAALTYYALMSLFPTLLLAVSLLGVLGEYPATYNAIIRHLRHVVPAVTLAPLDAAVRAALRSKGTAAAGLVIAILTALYGATGYLEAARRALNVVFEASRGRSFARRKLIDVASTL